MNLFDFTLEVKGFSIKKAEQKLSEIQSISEENYHHYITERKQEIVQYHLKNNSYYQNLAKNANPDDWNSLPVLQKSDLQQRLNDRLSDGFTKNNVYVNKTSGSGGHPFIFAKDKFSHALSWAIYKHRYAWHGIDLTKSLQARFYGIPLDRTGYYKERIKDRLSNRFRFPIFDLSDEKLEKIFRKFSGTAFQYINGYTSSIVLFAKFLQEKGITLKEYCPTLTLCMVTAEMLFPEDKLLIETQFGVPVVNEYGASELGIIGFTDTENRFVLDSETLFVEIIDESGNPVPHGTLGRIVITSLYNKAHPFIRYDIGDFGALDVTSTTKNPLLSQLIGRTNDIAILEDGKKVPGLAFYYVTKSIIEDQANVTEFIVLQTKPSTFIIKYVSKTNLTSVEEQAIKKGLETYVGYGLTIVLERVPVLERSKRGKLKQFESFV